MNGEEKADNGWLRLIERLQRESILKTPEVIRALKIVRRESFLPDNVKEFASQDSPLPIGLNQTISAPHN